MLIIEAVYEIGQTAYLKTDREQSPRIITGIQVQCNGGLIYRSACGCSEYWSADYELTHEPSIGMMSKG